MKEKKFLKGRVLGYGFLGLAILILVGWILRENNDWGVRLVRADINPNTNIHSTITDHWAWNDLIGWIDFHNTHSVIAQSKQIKGYASSSVGEISLNCDPTGNSGGADWCGIANYKVYNNGAGDLSGWAWNDAIGWISFCGTDNAPSSTPDCPLVAYKYGPIIRPLIEDQPPSDFKGWAWNDIVGWITFNCLDLETPCVNYNYRVRTEWYPTSTYGDVYSSIFDTEIPGGVQFNSVSFQASKPVGTEIWFQLATSNCSNGATNPPTCNDAGTWNFIGSDGTATSYYKVIDYGQWDSKGGRAWFATLENKFHNNARYFRYRVRLRSNKTQDATPVVNDVIVNWSP